MKLKVGSTSNEIEVGQYREVNKGGLKAFFTLIEYPYGRKTLDCRYFAKGNDRWFAFPQKEILKRGEEKPDYIPLISFLDRDYLEELKKAILSALKEQENGQSGSTKRQETSLQDDSSPVWF